MPTAHSRARYALRFPGTTSVVGTLALWRYLPVIGAEQRVGQDPGNASASAGINDAPDSKLPDDQSFQHRVGRQHAVYIL
jgi:hypothetical protein